MDKKTQALVEQYARSLVEVAFEQDAVSTIQEEVRQILTVFAETNLKTFLSQEDNTYDVTVTSASPLSEEQKARLLAIVSQKFEIKTRRLVEKIDEDLIGGFVIKAKNKVVDTSIRSQLQTFKTNLK